MNELEHYGIPGMRWGRKTNRKYKLDEKMKAAVPDLPAADTKISLPPSFFKFLADLHSFVSSSQNTKHIQQQFKETVERIRGKRNVKVGSMDKRTVKSGESIIKRTLNSATSK